MNETGCRQPAAATGDLPPAGIIVRPMTSADAAQVLAIYQAGLDGGEASFETRAPTWDAFDASHHSSHRHVAVAGTGGEVLGWAAVSPVSDRAYTRVSSSTPCTSPQRLAGAGSAPRCSTP